MHPDILQALINEHVRDLNADLQKARRVRLGRTR
jgi:hypothetical protein